MKFLIRRKEIQRRQYDKERAESRTRSFFA